VPEVLRCVLSSTGCSTGLPLPPPTDLQLVVKHEVVQSEVAVNDSWRCWRCIFCWYVTLQPGDELHYLRHGLWD